MSSVHSRLKIIREVAGLSRKDVERISKGEIKAASLSTFENNQSQISLQYLKKMVSFYDTHGVAVSYDWVLSGRGISPHEKNLLDNSLSIIQETELFKKNNPDSIIFTVTNNDFDPIIQAGDVIGGIKDENMHGQNLCIINTRDEYLLRLAKYCDNGLIVQQLNSFDSTIMRNDDFSKIYRVVFIRSN